MLNLFPPPVVDQTAHSLGYLVPAPLPGNDPASTDVLVRSLKENHEKNHVFFNDKGFHNHLTHFLFAIWSLGAPAHVIEKGFETSSYQRPAFKSPEPITDANFVEHLGDERYYNAYMQYMIPLYEKYGAYGVIEKVIFSPSFNYVAGRDANDQPEMLNRFMSSILHPMIHTGYGVEYNVPGMLIEGLGQTAVHQKELSKLFPPSLFTSSTITSTVIDTVTSSLKSVGVSAKDRPEIHALSILARVLKDTRLDINATGKIDSTGDALFAEIQKLHADTVTEHVDRWIESIDLSREGELQKKVEELLWTVTILYGIGGWDKDKGFVADFFIAHLVTSSVFIAPIIAGLSPSSQLLMLRGYLSVTLLWYIFRGRPPLRIAAFFENKFSSPSLEPSAESNKESGIRKGNPWFPILDMAMTHHDEHVPKLQRTLAHYGRLWGSSSSKDTHLAFDFSKTELEEAGSIDGTLFIRTAALTAERLIKNEHDESHEPKENIWDFDRHSVD